MSIAEKDVLTLKNASTANAVSITFNKQGVAALKLVASIAWQRSHHPALTGVLVQCGGGVVTASATDLTLHVISRIDACTSADDYASLVIPASVIKSLKAGQTLTIDGTTYSANGVSGIGLLNSEFPAHPTLTDDDQHELDVPGAYFDDMAAVASHASTSETRPILLAVHHEGNALTATDTYRLLRAERSETFPTPINVPAQYAKTLAKLFGETGAAMAYDANRVRYTADGIRAYVRQFDGNYPATDRIWPTTHNHVGTITDAAAWVDALTIAVRVAGKKDRDLHIALHAGRADLSLTSADGQTFAATVPYAGDGELSITFNPVYLLDALNAVGACTVHIIDAKQPVTFTNDSGRKALVSPIRCR